MIAIRGASALPLALALSACAGFIPSAPERSSQPPVARAPVPSPTPRSASRAIPDASLPPAPSADYRYEPSPLPFVREQAQPAESNAAGAGYASGPAIASLRIEAATAARALHAFRISCPIAINREDRTGLLSSADWVEPCRAAAHWPESDARRFFIEHFRAVRIADGAAFATGYYEPEIEASRARRPGYDQPIYRLPDDLVMRPQPRNFDPSPLPQGVRMVDGEMVPYHDRAAIEAGALAGRGLEIAWARDPVALFFFQIQGGGLLRLPDGSTTRLSYAGNNGYPYQSIGALLRERGLLEPGQATSQGIQDWLHAHPQEARALMNENRRYVFYAPSTGTAPYGSLAVYVTPRATVAADFRYAPPGAPVFLDLDQDNADGLWVVQDTGGAITGANRFDTFWGAGDEAHGIAGAISAHGEAWILLPRAAAARLLGD